MVHASAGGFPGFLRDCLDHVMSVALLRENYFWSVYLNGRYGRQRCPEYLKPENFRRLKAGLVERIETFTGTVTDCLAEEPEPLTAYVLLDHMDWLVREPRLLAEEWDRIFATARPGSAGYLPEWRSRRAVPARVRAPAARLRAGAGGAAPPPGPGGNVWLLPHRRFAPAG